jgi:hypothetical protein
MKDLPTFSEDCFVGGMYINGASNLFHGPELDHSNFEIYKNLATSSATAGDIFDCDWRNTYGDAAIVSIRSLARSRGESRTNLHDDPIPLTSDSRMPTIGAH